MIGNKIEELESLINEATTPVLVLVVSEACDSYASKTEFDVETTIKEHKESLGYVRICIDERVQTFPRIDAPVLYFFLPKKQVPEFWINANDIMRLPDDIEIIAKMHREGLTHEEARYTPEVQAQIKESEKIIEEPLDAYPPKFTQFRNFAKEMWSSSRRALSGMPVISPTEKAFHRMSTCEACDRFDEAQGRCHECGCYMKLKTHFETAKCPLSKW
jgi:hypothetical protein